MITLAAWYTVFLAYAALAVFCSVLWVVGILYFQSRTRARERAAVSPDTLPGMTPPRAPSDGGALAGDELSRLREEKAGRRRRAEALHAERRAERARQARLDALYEDWRPR